MKQVSTTSKPISDNKVTVDPQLITKDVQAYFNSGVSHIEEIKAGTCNRLFRFDLDDGRSVLVKFYFVDDRNRLSREFNALTFLQANGFENVPKAFYEDAEKGYAVYSFEPGQTKPTESITRSDLQQMMDFLVKLHSQEPEKITTQFPNAIFACFTYQDYIKNIEYRSEKFQAALDTNELSPAVSQFASEHNLVKLVESLVVQATKGAPKSELELPIDQGLRRLSMVDFGPHNTLFREDGTPCFVDLEYFGWDDPMRDIASFAEHDQLRKLPVEDRLFAIEYYRNNVKLPSASLDRLPVILQLVTIEWVSIHMLALTPMKIDLRKFGNPDFDQASYEKDQLTKLEKRLDDASKALA